MRRIVFALLALTTPPAFAAEPIPPSPIAKTELVVSAEAGKPAYAGVHFTLPKGWDIYWQNPGDSGIPTTLKFALPNGTTAGDLLWPTPERIEVSGLVNYGYHDAVTLVAPLSGDLKGDFTLKANWLVCRDICIPEKAEFKGSLPGSNANASLVATAATQLPISANIAASYTTTHDSVTLRFSGVDLPRARDAIWFPIEDGIIQNATAQSVTQQGAALTITVPRGSDAPLQSWRGVLKIAEKSYAVSASFAGNEAATHAQLQPLATHHPLPTLLLFAFLGGLILNIMPCVLPILALKALALTKKAEASRTAAARQGVAYTAGVVLSFLAIAGLMLALKSGGAAIGWGFQLQNVPFVLFLGLVMLAVSANLWGMFALPVLFGKKATGIDDSSLRGSFLTGALAVLVATPCTAPFMATAIGATLALPTLPALAVFAMLGLGMAAPFLLISLWPAARRALPKPGAWMLTFKKLLALPILATALWLFWVAASMLQPSAAPANSIPYDAAKLQQLRDAGTPVLVDATADWCLTCKVNERMALKPEATQALLREHKVQLMVADWTNSDPAITAYLASFGRNGVPLVVYYAPHAEPVILPQILTPGIVREAISSSAK